MNKTDFSAESDSGPARNPIDLRDLLQTFLETWWLLLPVAALAAAVAYVYVERMPLRFTAKAVLQVEQEEQRLISIEDVSQQDLRASEVLNTIVANMKNSSVLVRVVRTNSLTTDPAFVPGRTTPLTENQAMNILAGMVTGKLRRDTRLIDILVEHDSPDMARKLANSMAHEFIRQNLEQRFSTTQAANVLLYEETTKLRAKLEESEKALQAYKEVQETLSNEDRENIFLSKLQDLSRSYTEVKARRVQLEADFEQILLCSNRAEVLLTLPTVLEDPSIAQLRHDVIALEAQVQTMALRYKDKYPRMVQAQRELQDLRDSLQKQVLEAPRFIEASYEGLVAREANLERALKEAQQEALELEKKAIQYRVLEREVETDRALYDSVLKRLKETDLTKGLEKQCIAIVEPAGPPKGSSRPSIRLVLPSVALASLLAGLGLIYLFRLLGGSIRTVDQAENTFGLPVLAAVPKIGRRLSKGSRLVLEENPDSFCAEAFRSLRTFASLNSGDEARLSYLFTSAIPSEGKTFCSMNFALSLAQEGHRTLLIDLDLRRPAVGGRFKLPFDAPGATDFLRHVKPLAELVQPTKDPNFFYLPAGTLPVNPAELLTRQAVQRLLAEAGETFAKVVVDSAPINAVSDTFLILPEVQASFLVLRAVRTPTRAIARALEMLARSSVQPIGLVLNFMPERSGYHYHYHYCHTKDYEYRGHRTASSNPA